MRSLLQLQLGPKLKLNSKAGRAEFEFAFKLSSCRKQDGILSGLKWAPIRMCKRVSLEHALIAEHLGEVLFVITNADPLVFA